MNGKKPIHEGYHDRDYTLDEINGHNAGLMVNQGLVDIDLDWPETMGLHNLLPPTCAIFGRVEGGTVNVTHRLYQCDIEPMDFKLPAVPGAPTLEGPHANTILQIRTAHDGKPYHVMCPESKHPETEQTIDWQAQTAEQTDYLPSVVDADDLRRKAGVVAAAAFFVRFYPAQGSRDDFALCLTGTLLRAGWSEENADLFTGGVAKLSGDEEHQMRGSHAGRSARRLQHERKVAGLPKMAKLLGVPMDWVVEIATWLGARKSSGAPAVFINEKLPEVSRQAWTALAMTIQACSPDDSRNPPPVVFEPKKWGWTPGTVEFTASGKLPIDSPS